MQRALSRVALLVGILAAPPLHAKTLYIFAPSPDVPSIAVTDEECGLKSEVTNLPRRAVWTENGVDTEGCVGMKYGVFLFYFADKTVTFLPTSVFNKVEDA